MEVKYSTKFKMNKLSDGVYRVIVCGIAKLVGHSELKDIQDFKENECRQNLFDLANKAAYSMRLKDRIAEVSEESEGGEKFYPSLDYYEDSVSEYDSVSAIVSFTSRI